MSFDDNYDCVFEPGGNHSLAQFGKLMIMDEEAAMTDRPPGSNPGSVISIDDLLNTSNSVRSKPRLFLLYTVIVLQFVIFVTELITDQFLHSLLILTDSYHHLFNTCNGILLVLTFKVCLGKYSRRIQM